MLMDLFFRHLVTLFMIILFSIILCKRKSFRDMETKYFWMTVIICFVLILEDVLEVFAAENPDLLFWRILLSVIGYTFRSIAVLSLLLVIVPQNKRSVLLWIPAVITLLVCSTAFFSDLAFGFDEEYSFYRGPLGYVAFIVPIIYLILLLWNAVSNFTAYRGSERLIIPVGGLFCLTASIVDAFIGGIRFDEAIMICTIIFYILLYSHDNRRDTLTGLLNRQAYYDDCIQLGKSISAVASLDMNGLKELNDTKGHKAGDNARMIIGECIREAVTQKNQVYRIGGDEFVILFFENDEEMIINIQELIKENVSKKGYSISIGYAMVNENRNPDEAIRESDRLMYEDKSRFYSESGKNRRIR